MSNVLADDKHHQIVALGRLGWSLRRIERTTGVRRETISGYLKAVGIVVPGRGRRRASPAKPAISPASLSTDSGGANPAGSEAESPDAGDAKARFSNDSSRVVGYSVGASGENAVIVWRTDGSVAPRLLPSQGAIEDVQFSPDGERVLVLTALSGAFIWPTS